MYSDGTWKHIYSRKYIYGKWVHYSNACVRDGNACVRDGHACVRDGHACVRDGNACVRDGDACVRDGNACMLVELLDDVSPAYIIYVP